MVKLDSPESLDKLKEALDTTIKERRWTYEPITEGHDGTWVTYVIRRDGISSLWYRGICRRRFQDGNNCQCGPISAGMKLVDKTSTYPQDVTEGMLGVVVSQMQPQTSGMPLASGMPSAPQIPQQKSLGYY